ncbi:Ribosomal lysine N-methyltransferase 4 [Candida viswanathii]|uniref:Ribosomal lysine N-methyltransferase 4 n=1 Tax=Candida viswanathii TaxID=5486 RepID=A0A367YJM7_9ASCO|nr:Ribosomal lysine N-methyltransferase 4 [Candida viswanathii]
MTGQLQQPQKKDDTFTTKTNSFLGWLVSNNVQISPKISIHDYRSTNQGRGIIATADIEANEQLFTLPRSVLINVVNNSLIEKYPAIQDNLKSMDQWLALIIILSYESKFGTKWKHYFSVIPDEFNQLSFWKNDELRDLEPSCILERIGKENNLNMYNQVIKIIDDLRIVELQGQLSVEEYNRIATTIMSYSFDVEVPKPKKETNGGTKENGEHNDDEEHDDDEELEEDEEEEEDEYYKSMVPLADTLNADTHLNNAVLMYSETDLIMTSIKRIPQGEQVYNIYSEHPNSELLRRYGYVEPQGSKYEFGEIPISIIKSYFVTKYGITKETLNRILDLVNHEFKLENEHDEELLLDSYDAFNSGDVIIELVFLIQILTVILTIDPESNSEAIHRIFSKVYQLIEAKKVTKQFVENYQEILAIRLGQYPEIAKTDYEEFSDNNLSRKQMAEIVLKSEYKSLKNCFEIKDYKVIDDEKLIKNIIKKRAAEDDGKTTKKSKK